MIASIAILSIILVVVASFTSMTSSTYGRVSGQIDVFQAASAAFDSLTQTVRQATLLSYLGYDSPTQPKAYQLKSDLHFIIGTQTDLGFANTGAPSTMAIFFQAPIGVSTASSLQPANALLNDIGFFIAYGPDPSRPDLLGTFPVRYRYRLLEFLQPREAMTLYEYSITKQGDVPVSSDAYDGEEWFKTDVDAAAATQKYCHVLAENVIDLVILPVYRGAAAPFYKWDSRDTSPDASYSHNRVPQALQIMMAVIDEPSAIKLGNSPAPVSLVSNKLFTDPLLFASDVQQLDADLGKHANFPPLNYRIFSATIPLNPSNTNL